MSRAGATWPAVAYARTVAIAAIGAASFVGSVCSLHSVGVTGAWLTPSARAEIRSATKIENIRLEADGEVDAPRVLDLLGLRKGEQFSSAGLEQGLGRLAETAKFKSVEGGFDAGTGELVVRLASVETLRGVELRINAGINSGADAGVNAGQDQAAPKTSPEGSPENSPVPASALVPEAVREDIGDVIGISDGEPVHLELLDEVRERVVNRLQERGYLEARALAVLEQRDDTNNRRLVLSVELGARSRVTELVLRGFTADDAEEFLDHLRDQNEIEQFLRNLRLPKDFLDRSAEILKRRLEKLNLKGADAPPVVQPEVRIAVDLPMDWIALNQSVGQWGQRERGQGYFDFQVKMEPQPAGPDSNGAGVRVSVDLQRGYRYNVQIHGNVEFWERELRTKILDRTLRLGVPLSVPDSENLLRRMYEAAGYAQATVTSRIQDRGDRRVIRIDIREGTRTYLGDLTLDGVPDTEFSEVQRALKNWRQALESPFHPIYYDEKFLRAQLPELLRRIRRRGFLQARILEFRSRERDGTRYVDVELPVQLGPRFTVKSLTVEGNLAYSDRELEKLIRLAPGDPVDPDLVNEINQGLYVRHRDLGFLNVRVEADEKKMFRTSFDSPEVDVELRVTPGPQVFVGRVLVRGTRKTKEAVVTREFNAVGIRSGAAWSPTRVQAAEQRLLSLGIFGTAKSESVGGRLLDDGRSSDKSFERQEKDLKIQMAETPAGTVEFGPGFRSDRGLIGFAEFSYRNLGGWNRSVIARTQVSRKLQNYQLLEQKHSLTFIEPYLADLPLRFRANATYTQEDNTVFAGSSAVSGYKSRELSVGAAVETDVARNLRLTQNLYTLSFPYDFGIIGASDRRNNRVASMGTLLTFDNRDNIFNPTRGWIVSSGIDLSSPVIGSDQDSNFAVFRQSVGTYLRLSPISIVALSLSYARLWGMGATTGIPLTRRLTLGGRTSIRALSEKELQFNDDGLVGQDSFEGKVEYRQPILLDLGVAFFVDFGVLSALRFVNPTRPARYTPFQVGPGVGFRYATPVGPLALDFAFDTSGLTGKSPFRIQFSIGSF